MFKVTIHCTYPQPTTISLWSDANTPAAAITFANNKASALFGTATDPSAVPRGSLTFVIEEEKPAA
jgi:hypothetical protein